MNQQEQNERLTAEEILNEVNARIAEEEASQDAGQESEQEQENLGYLPVPPPFPVEAFPLPCQKVIREIAAAYAPGAQESQSPCLDFWAKKGEVGKRHRRARVR